MPSVTVVWKGSRSDPRIRYRLLSYLDRLAARSDEYFRRAEPKQPARLKALNKQNGNATHLRPNVELFDEEMSGSILISSWISPNPEILVDRAREVGVRLVADPKAKGPPLIRIDKARLRGVDFKLFDPRGLYLGADRMSFVFLERTGPTACSPGSDSSSSAISGGIARRRCRAMPIIVRYSRSYRQIAAPRTPKKRPSTRC